MPRNLRAAGLVIYRRAADTIEYLLLQTSYGQHHWTPPKGHVDPGETDKQTALRETEEEAGFTEEDLRITDFSKTVHYDVKGVPKSVIYWLAELVKNTPVKLSSEHQSFKWLPLAEACKLAQYNEMQEVLRDCHQYLNKGSR